MMKKLLMYAMVIGVASLASVSYAAEKATTDELPAALRALQPNQNQILTTTEAEAIRGEGGYGGFLPGILNGWSGSQSIWGLINVNPTQVNNRVLIIGNKNKVKISTKVKN